MFNVYLGTKTCHFRDILPSLSLALVFKKPAIQRVQALADILQCCIAMKPCTDCKSAKYCTTRGTPYHFSKLHPGPCSSVGMRRGTDRQTHTHVTNIHFTSATPHVKCNKHQMHFGCLVWRPAWKWMGLYLKRGSCIILTGIQHILCGVIKPFFIHHSSLIELRFLRATRYTIGHFRYILPSQSLGIILKKLNVTHQEHTHTNIL